MAAARSGDVAVDVGAHIGLYSIALAQRVGPSGKVIAFEPDPDNASHLAENVRLNGVADRLELRREAVGAVAGEASFASNGIESSIVAEQTGLRVPVVTLDEALRGSAVGVLKIDVEGFEEGVLRGARGLLGAQERRPRVVFLEVHPFAWHRSGTTSESLLEYLQSVGYRPETLAGAPVRQLDRWCEIIAVPVGG
jgi:FkbM family methyltransferase